MRTIKKTLKILGIFVVIGFICFYAWLQTQYVVPILMYHHIKSRPIKELNVVTPKEFERQMSFIKKFGYKVLTFDEYVDIYENGGNFSRNSVVITFDDGYQDNYEFAFPVLKKYGFSAIEFVVSDLIGKRNMLTWKQIKEMDQAGIIIGSHTRHHRYLPNIMDEELQNEIVESKKVLEAGLGKEVKYFSYPTGGFSEEIKDLAKQAGYKAAFTTNRGYDRRNKDLFELKRIHMNNHDNWFSMFAKLSGFYNVFRKFKSPYSEDDSLGAANLYK